MLLNDFQRQRINVVCVRTLSSRVVHCIRKFVLILKLRQWIHGKQVCVFSNEHPNWLQQVLHFVVKSFKYKPNVRRSNFCSFAVVVYWYLSARPLTISELCSNKNHLNKNDCKVWDLSMLLYGKARSLKT